MGREVRRVPKDWKHPKDARGRHVPLLGGSFKADAEEWDKGNGLWQQGAHPHQRKYPDTADMAFEDWEGARPDARDYMPDWPDSERTHYQMYEDTSEGTPLSPVMGSPEELARWLVDNKASAFAGQTASYEAWLRVAKGEWAPSAVIRHGQHSITSGVEALTSDE